MMQKNSEHEKFITLFFSGVEIVDGVAYLRCQKGLNLKDCDGKRIVVCKGSLCKIKSFSVICPSDDSIIARLGTKHKGTKCKEVIIYAEAFTGYGYCSNAMISDRGYLAFKNSIDWFIDMIKQQNNTGDNYGR